MRICVLFAITAIFIFNILYSNIILGKVNSDIFNLLFYLNTVIIIPIVFSIGIYFERNFYGKS